MKKKKKQLPAEGKTDYNETIYKYLLSLGKSVYQNQDYNSGKHKGFAWNADSMWGISVSEAGSKPFYTNEFLLECIPPKFIKDKWYKNLGTDKDYIAKFDKLRDDDFWVSEYINNKKYHKDSGTVNFDHVTECSLEEIQQYLPDGHVDKITIPQYVKCIGLSEQRTGGWTNDYEIGKVYKVKRLCNAEGDYSILFNENEDRNCPKDQFVSSTKKEYDAQNKPKETELEVWLKETKALNLSLDELSAHINSPIKSGKVYNKLSGEYSTSKVKILYNEWNPKEVIPEYKVGDWVTRTVSVGDVKSKLTIGRVLQIASIHGDNFKPVGEDSVHLFSSVYKATGEEILKARGELAHEKLADKLNKLLADPYKAPQYEDFYKILGTTPKVRRSAILEIKKDFLSYSVPVKIKNKNKLFKF